MIDKATALFLAQHCKYVYDDNYRPDKQIVISHFREENINGYTFERKGTVYVVIAGTDDIKDAVADAKFISKRLSGESYFTRVHTGFYNSYEKIEQHIVKAASENKPVILAGHSLGGAIATIAAYKLSSIGKNVTCVTFGSPRVGGYLFTKKYNKLVKKSYRFVYKNDAVTRVPTAGLFYFHVNKELQSKGKSFFSYFGSPTDHYIDKYINGIKSNKWNL